MEKNNQNRIMSDKKWLIRSSSKILGPFTVQEVTQLIAARQIAIIDEVKQPLERWSYIRENPIFVELVKALRNEQETSVEHTMATSTMTSQTQRLGLTRTDVIYSDESTPPPSVAQQNQIKEITLAKEIKIDPAASPLLSKAKAYGSVNDPRILEKRRNFEKRLKISLTLLIISLVGALYFRHFMREREKAESLQKVEKIAHLHFTQGLGKSALSGFRKVMSIRNLSDEYQYDFAILLLHSGDSIDGRRRVEGLLGQSQLSRDRRVELLNALGASYLDEGNVQLAAENFRKAQAFDSSSFVSQLNEIQLKMAQQSNLEAFRLGQQILARYPHEIELKVLMNIAAIRVLSSGRDFAEIDTYLDKQRRYLRNRNYLSQEFTITFLHLMLLKHKTWNESFEQLLWQVFNSSLFQRDQFADNYFLSRTFLDWSHYKESCLKVAEQTQNAYAEILKAYCYLEGDELSEAQNLINNVLVRSPKNTLAMILQGAVLMKTGKVSEAIAAFDSVASSQYMLGNYLKMQACYASNSQSCATDAATRVLKMRPNDSMASFFEAERLIASEQRRQAWDAISRGLGMDENYIPLIQIRSQLEGSF